MILSPAKEYTLKLVITVAFIIGLVLAFIFLKDSEPVWFGVSVTVIMVGSIGAMIMVTTERSKCALCESSFPDATIKEHKIVCSETHAQLLRSFNKCNIRCEMCDRQLPLWPKYLRPFRFRCCNKLSCPLENEEIANNGENCYHCYFCDKSMCSMCVASLEQRVGPVQPPPQPQPQPSAPQMVDVVQEDLPPSYESVMMTESTSKGPKA